MAGQGDAKEEIVTHWRGYSAFIRMMTWGTAIAFLVGLIVILLISN